MLTIKKESTIAGGSLVNANTVDDTAKTQEDLEANAFAGLLLMSDVSMEEQLPMQLLAICLCCVTIIDFMPEFSWRRVAILM